MPRQWFNRYIAERTPCPTQRSSGTRCNNGRCPFGHEFVSCNVCQRVFVQITYQQHLNGGPHRRAVARAQRSLLPQQLENRRADEMYCRVCESHVLLSLWERHPSTRSHKLRQRYAEYKQALEVAESDKNGVTVNESINFGIVSPSVSAALTRPLTVITNRNQVVRLVKVNKSNSGSSPFTITGDVSKVITNDRALHLQVRLQPAGFAGILPERVDLILTAETSQGKTTFSISRTIEAVIGNADDLTHLAPENPFVPRAPQEIRPEPALEDLEVGPRPPEIVQNQPWIRRIGVYPIPKRVQKVSAGKSVSEQIRIAKALLPSTFNAQTHAAFFKNLIYLEELQATRDMATYDLTGVEFKAGRAHRGHRLGWLDVAGLAENRPSVLVNDDIDFRESGNDDVSWARGSVWKVTLNTVGVNHPRLQRNLAGQLYDVRFKLKRTSIRREHLGLDEPIVHPSMFFPTTIPPLPRNRVEFFDEEVEGMTSINPLIQNNPEQKRAVVAIKFGKHHIEGEPRPFVLRGPPGTGKTSTIVEAIHQLVSDPHTTPKILACAPSNAAADLLLSRLSTRMLKSQLFRLNAVSRSSVDVSATVKKHSKRDNNGWVIPSADELMSYRVVVSTCLSALLPHELGVEKGHFTHIMVDEAGQATEPQVLCGYKISCDANTHFILAGDPKQLGPVLRSPVAQQLGLQQSFLERIMARDGYDRQRDWRLCVKLLKSFRAHPALLKFPNEQFYQGELIEAGDRDQIRSLENWSGLPKRGFPLVFWGVQGKDERENHSPSFFNVHEANVVLDLVVELTQQAHVSVGEIAVIAPYHAQVVKIKRGLQGRAERNRQGELENVLVGSVEMLQGQERRVIIISTVRSNRDYLDHDKKYALGFLDNPRRLNVAITRAKALLIIVGDPDILGTDPLWRAQLSYIKRNGGCKGKLPNWDANEQNVPDGSALLAIAREDEFASLNNLAAQISALDLTEQQGDLGQSARQDEPWQRVDA